MCVTLAPKKTVRQVMTARIYIYSIRSLSAILFSILYIKNNNLGMYISHLSPLKNRFSNYRIFWKINGIKNYDAV